MIDNCSNGVVMLIPHGTQTDLYFSDWNFPSNLNFCCLFQALELNSYFKAFGASNLDDERASDEDLANIVAVADLCFKVCVSFYHFSCLVFWLFIHFLIKGRE